MKAYVIGAPSLAILFWRRTKMGMRIAPHHNLYITIKDRGYAPHHFTAKGMP